MAAVGVHLLAVLQLLPTFAISLQKDASVSGKLTNGENLEERLDGASVGHTNTALGVMSRSGVTRYQQHALKKTKRTDGKFFWSDSANNRDSHLYSGATDLLENLSWSWHHPAGMYNTIPVGSPLIDAEMNIYIGSDDAIRKFNIVGDILWSYAPRGQLAAAPTMAVASSRRVAAPVQDEWYAEQEDLLKPDWADSESDAVQISKDFKVGDLVRVKPGASFRADGSQLYKAGDQGLISGVVEDDDGNENRAVVLWTRTGRKSIVQIQSMKSRFERVAPKKAKADTPIIVGSTTSGYVFAIDLESGEELWASWASNDIAGVKGSVAAKDGVVVAATNRCTDRYCYRYRNQTVPIVAGNLVVRGLSALDGSPLWEYKTFSPVWNMNPLWGPDGSVLFQDWEGRLYSLDLQTGALRFKVGGDIGTNTLAAAVYDPGHNIAIAMGMKHYNVQNYHMANALGFPVGKYCNPYPAPGILPHCGTWPGLAGFVRGYNATSGREIWEQTTPEPPAGASIGMVHSLLHTRLVLTMGFNCFHSSPSQIWAIDPNDGAIRWQRDGPTLWTNYCAGDKEGDDIRRAMGGRARCAPNSWSAPAVDSAGDIYVGNQVGVLQRWGTPGGCPTGSCSTSIQVLSTLTTGAAFQDAAIAFGDGVMAVSTCTALIVFQTYSQLFSNETWSYKIQPTSDTGGVPGGRPTSEISETAHEEGLPTAPPLASETGWVNPWDVR
jgi:outer membrane protein assembly factor BamB